MPKSKMELPYVPNQSLEVLVDTIKKQKILELFLQPIVNANNYSNYGFEVLSRWSFGEMTASRVPFYMLDRVAITRLFEMIHKFPKERLFVNCDIQNLWFITPYVRNASHDRRIVIELDFGQGLFEFKTFVESVEKINEIKNVEFAIDDMGKYSLDRKVINFLKPAYLKVDISIIKGISHSLKKQRLLGEISLIAEDINAQIIVEGIEDELDAAFLKKHKFPLVQGFYFKRPGRWEEFTRS